MKSLTSTMNESMNESRYRNIDLNPSVSLQMFGKEVKDIKDLRKNKEYILHEPGMNEWVGNLEYMGLKNGKHLFKSTMQYEDFSIEYSEKELVEEIKDKLVIEQK